jgi:hypothetical protein
MRYNFIQPFPRHLDNLSPKEVYSIGELGCVKTLVSISQGGKNVDSLAMGIGPDDEPWGIVGCHKQWDGFGQVWGILDRRLDQHPIALLKSCIILLNYAVQKQKLRRVSVTVRSGYTKGNRFAHALGFDFEGKMAGYLPDGGDANLYARLF